MIVALGSREPLVCDSAWIAPTAAVVGEVRLGENVGVWYGAVLRGDDASIVVGSRSNIQDGCVLHADPDRPITIGTGVTVGHNTTLHGCTIGDDVMIGMGATVLNGARIGNGSLVAAGALVPQHFSAPERSLIVGAPATVRRVLTDEEVTDMLANANHYVDLAGAHRRAVLVRVSIVDEDDVLR
jgi:carbonic anhydrase/acetyltransferase-like protein (isoleucine patch superfamily)